MKSVCLYRIGVVVILGVHETTAMQVADQKQEWLYNYPSSSLQLAAVGESGAGLELHNLGKATIVEYQFGCVVLQQGAPLVVLQMENKDSQIAPQIAELRVATHGLAERAKCENRRSKLAIIRVGFADGGVWTVLTNPKLGRRR